MPREAFDGAVGLAFDAFFDMAARTMLEVPGQGDTHEVIKIHATLTKVEERLREVAAHGDWGALAQMLFAMHLASGSETRAWAFAGTLPEWCPCPWRGG
jgi:hypothetical protein